MSGAKTVVALIDKDGAYIDALNPLPIVGGSGGSGGIVVQGAGTGSPLSPWTTRVNDKSHRQGRVGVCVSCGADRTVP